MTSALDAKATAHVGGYRADIDGLRAVAVMAVVLHHLSAGWVPGGFVGVDVFFVISGYLITKIINREMQDGSFTFTRFYERRIRRLFPVLFTVLGFVLVAGWLILLPSDYLATSRAAAGTLLFSANIVFWRDLSDGYFAADAKLNPLLHMWSLGVEEQFYLLFPLALLLMHRYARRWLAPAILVAFFLSFGLSIVFTPIKPVASYFLLPTRAWEMLAGSLLAVAAIPQVSGRGSRELLALAGLTAIVVPVFFYSLNTTFPGYAALLPVAGTVMLIWVGGGPATCVGRLLQLRPVVYVGLISYSLYLWHWPLIVFAKFQNGLDSIRHLIPFIFLASLLMAALSHKFIENKFRRKKDGSHSREFYIGVSAAAAALIAVSIPAIMTAGFPQRYPSEISHIDAVRRDEVPYKQCESRLGSTLEKLCVIGESTVAPEILLWGDSHMLAWAPGMDAALKDIGKSAFFAPNSACPPILGVNQSTDPSCRAQNDSVMAALLRENAGRTDGGVRTVVLSGFWQKYFNESNLHLSSEDIEGGNAKIAAPALVETVNQLKTSGTEVLIMGAVPAYRADVPYSIASGNQKNLVLQFADMRSTNEYAELSRLDGFVDVAKWFCDSRCLIQDEGGVVYRDANHLSVHGSERFKNRLVEMFANSDVGPSQ